MAEIQYFIDNQNCLWIPNKPEEISEEEINPLSQILEKAENKNKSLYLNHSNLIDKYENPDVIIPNNIETFYYRITFRNCIKRIYVPASVKKLQLVQVLIIILKNILWNLLFLKKTKILLV